VDGLDYPISSAALNDVQRQNISARPWRVGVVKGPKWAYVEEYAKEALLSIARVIDELPNVEVEELSLPAAFDSAHDIHATIYDRTLAYYFKEEFKKHSLVSPLMYEIINRGNNITLDDYTRALERQAELARQLDQIFVDKYDVLLNLSTGGEPLKGLASVDRPDNCLIWTMCGVPAISVPSFQGPNGLPFGLQAVARRFSDYLLLNFVRVLRTEGLAPDGTNPKPACA